MATRPDEAAPGRETIENVADWLAFRRDGPMRADQLMTELCERLAAAGMPLFGVNVFVTTLHPDILGRRFRWEAGKGISVVEAPNSLAASPEFRNSPAVHVAETGETLRRRFIDPDCVFDYEVLREFAAEGITDYLCHPLPMANGERQAASWSTKSPRGFTEREIAVLGRVCLPLARLVEIYAMRRTAVTLLRTYVGPGSGERVLDGHIKRGELQTIHAAIWFADLRGFTALSDTLDGPALVALLNDYFDCLVPAIQAAGGEVLKFIGDGLLAIFPVTERTREAAACAAALAAARDSLSRLAALNARRTEGGLPTVRFGLALHLGEVLYGNVGAAGRLDFTTIGPAVNLAARLQALAGELGREVVLSDAFAEACGETATPIGRHALRGFRAPQTVYALGQAGAA